MKYIEELLEILAGIKQAHELKNILYEIIVNLLEIMNKERIVKEEGRKIQ